MTLTIICKTFYFLSKNQMQKKKIFVKTLHSFALYAKFEHKKKNAKTKKITQKNWRRPFQKFIRLFSWQDTKNTLSDNKRKNLSQKLLPNIKKRPTFIKEPTDIMLQTEYKMQKILRKEKKKNSKRKKFPRQLLARSSSVYANFLPQSMRNTTWRSANFSGKTIFHRARIVMMPVCVTVLFSYVHSSVCLAGIVTIQQQLVASYWIDNWKNLHNVEKS